MEIIDNRKQKQDEPFEIKVGEVIIISDTPYIFSQIDHDKFNAICLLDGLRWSDPITLDVTTIMSDNAWFATARQQPVTRVKAKVIIED